MIFTEVKIISSDSFMGDDDKSKDSFKTLKHFLLDSVWQPGSFSRLAPWFVSTTELPSFARWTDYNTCWSYKCVIKVRSYYLDQAILCLLWSSEPDK